MEVLRAVDWSREPEAVLDRLDHLQDFHRKQRRTY